MDFTQSWPEGFKTRVITVVQGDFQVSSRADIAYSTILGSCVSVCLFDPVAQVGGMNHYLLAESSTSGSSNLKYGAHAMELLINKLLRIGAERSQLRSKVFGGSQMSTRFKDIGFRNIQFARKFLGDEGFPVLAEDVGGNAARRINFHPYSGAVRISRTSQLVEADEAVLMSRKRPKRDPDPIVLF